jgi:hypothetical protein
MLVFWQQRLALLATPKTGTTAIEAALESLAAVVIQRPPQLKHTSVHRFHRFIGPYLETSAGEPFTVVALMREPRDWLGSWYRYRQREDMGDDRKRTSRISFDDFVRAYCSEAPPEYANVGSQSRFLAAKNGRGVDRLFRYEKIEDFIDFLEDRLNCEIILPRLNVSPQADLHLSPETETLLRRFAARDFDLYDELCRG